MLALGLLVVPAAARAHAHLDRADPKVGSTVAAPTQVRIWFDSDVEPGSSSVAVQGPGGVAIGDGHGRVDPSDRKLLEMDVPHLAPGEYRVRWSAATSDGHRTFGHYTFTVR